MGTIKTLGDKAWREYVTDGLASSGHNKPKKSEIREFVTAVDSADQVITIALEVERQSRIAADNTERSNRIAGEQNLQVQIDGINHELDDFADNVARAEAAKDEAEAAASNASALVDAAAAGFTGTTDGIAYDYGWTKDPFTYFDRDYGWTKDPVTP